jgi:hypothetical protein
MMSVPTTAVGVQLVYSDFCDDNSKKSSTVVVKEKAGKGGMINTQGARGQVWRVDALWRIRSHHRSLVGSMLLSRAGRPV